MSKPVLSQDIFNDKQQDAILAAVKAIVERDTRALSYMDKYSQDETGDWWDTIDEDDNIIELVMPPGDVSQWSAETSGLYEDSAWIIIDMYDINIGITDYTLQLELKLETENSIWKPIIKGLYIQ